MAKKYKCSLVLVDKDYAVKDLPTRARPVPLGDSTRFIDMNQIEPWRQAEGCRRVPIRAAGRDIGSDGERH